MMKRKFAYPLKLEVEVYNEGADFDAGWDPLNQTKLFKGETFTLSGYTWRVMDWTINEYKFNNEQIEIMPDGTRIDWYDMKRLKKTIKDLIKERDAWKAKAEKD